MIITLRINGDEVKAEDGMTILEAAQSKEIYYKEKPNYPKEAGVIETISKQIEENRKIDEYIEIDEYVDALKIFIQECLHLELIEMVDSSKEERMSGA